LVVVNRFAGSAFGEVFSYELPGSNCHSLDFMCLFINYSLSKFWAIFREF
jgi:hypothetical protein